MFFFPLLPFPQNYNEANRVKQQILSLLLILDLHSDVYAHTASCISAITSITATLLLAYNFDLYLKHSRAPWAISFIISWFSFPKLIMRL